MRLTIRTAQAIVLLAVLALAASGPVSAQGALASPTKEQVLDHWVAALGGRDNLQNAHVIHISGTIKTAGMEGTYERWATSRGEFRMAVEIPGTYRQVIIFDGQKGWVLDRNGAVQDLSGDRLQGVISSAFEASNSFLFSGFTSQLSFASRNSSRGMNRTAL